MIQAYKTVAIIYGGSGRSYAARLNDKILTMADKHRYPIAPRMIMESILTAELLSDVMRLFRESEVCVAILTADDCLVSEDGSKKYRLRQNVVFELGMALLQLGREKCILLCDFDPRGAVVELPSDMNSLELRRFSPEDADAVFDEVLCKILALGGLGDAARGAAESYAGLFTRAAYHLDYEELFPNDTNDWLFGNDCLTKILSGWLSELAAFTHYDERCIYLLERIGFLPIFGKNRACVDFLREAAHAVRSYKPADIHDYGGKALPDFAHDLLINVIAYTDIKQDDARVENGMREYLELIEEFLLSPPPTGTTVNPLLPVAYYNYLGLTYMRVHRLLAAKKQPEEIDPSFIKKARTAFETAAEYLPQVDMSLQIWGGFLYYNLARAEEFCGNPEAAAALYRRAIHIRKRWISTTQYNITIRNALSYEYFIAKIDYAAMQKRQNLITGEELSRTYDIIEAELNTYTDAGDSLESLLYIRKILTDKRRDA